MELSEVVTMIANFGFPITCVIAMFWLWNKERIEHAEESKKWISALDNNTEVMRRILDKIGDDNR